MQGASSITPIIYLFLFFIPFLFILFLGNIKSEKTENNSAEQVKVERAPPRNEPVVQPVNGIVQPPVVPPASRPGRITNQLLYLKNQIVKGMFFREIN